MEGRDRVGGRLPRKSKSCETDKRKRELTEVEKKKFQICNNGRLTSFLFNGLLCFVPVGLNIEVDSTVECRSNGPAVMEIRLKGKIFFSPLCWR